MTTPTSTAFDFDALPRLSGPQVKLPARRSAREVKRHELRDAFRIALRPQHLIWIAVWAGSAALVASKARTLVRVNPFFGVLILISSACLLLLFVGVYAPVIERERIEREIERLKMAYDRL